MNQLEETLGGWVRFLFVAFTGRVENGGNSLVAACPGAEHAAIACISLLNVGFAFTKLSRSILPSILRGFELFAMMNIITACFVACLSAGIRRIKGLKWISEQLR